MDELARTRLLLEKFNIASKSLSEESSSLRRRLEVPFEASLPAAGGTVASRAGAEDTPCDLLLLPRDVQINIINMVADNRALHALSQTCRSLREMVLSQDELWRPLCARDFNVHEADASNVICLKSRRLGIVDFFAAEVDAFISQHTPHRATTSFRWWHGDSWRAIYRDRHLGWSVCKSMLHYLRSMHHPAQVTGKRHRFQVFLMLCYLDQLTAGARDEAGLKQAVLDLGGLLSLRALLHNENGIFVQMAASVLANMAFSCDAALSSLLRLGADHSLSELLLAHSDTEILREVSRALVNLLCKPGQRVPQVLLPHHLETSSAAGDSGQVNGGPSVCEQPQARALQVPEFPPSSLRMPFGDAVQPQIWHYIEFNSLGEGSAPIPISFRFEGDGSFCATGTDAVANFTMEGSVDASTGQWTFVRRYLGGSSSDYQVRAGARHVYHTVCLPACLCVRLPALSLPVCVQCRRESGPTGGSSQGQVSTVPVAVDWVVDVNGLVTQHQEHVIRALSGYRFLAHWHSTHIPALPDQIQSIELCS
eukprot:jgi/Mesvir1/19324/Mv10386-RA.1